MKKSDVVIVGGGVIGLAHAYQSVKRGLSVQLIERDWKAQGASVRNFGLIWPIGQEAGPGREMAMRSRQHWLEVSKEAGFWLNQNGSLHLAYHEDEVQVLQEFIAVYESDGDDDDVEWMDVSNIQQRWNVVNPDRLQGGLFSHTECTVNPREAVVKLSDWLQSKWGVQMNWGEPVIEIQEGKVRTPRGTYAGKYIIICNGSDFETLFPEVFEASGLYKCKLQMMRAIAPEITSIGPSLCAGLTLRHYASFKKCPSLQKLDNRYDQANVLFKKYGIHVLLAQHEQGELIIGDSHQYGQSLPPFNQEEIDLLILEYLKTFTALKEVKISERWYGIYPKVDGKIYFKQKVRPGVWIVNGLGGAGMTLSFGLAEEMMEELLSGER